MSQAGGIETSLEEILGGADGATGETGATGAAGNPVGEIGDTGDTGADDGAGNPAGGELDDDSGALSENSKLAEQYGVSEDRVQLAKNNGWAPLEKFRGDPKDHKGPEEFLTILDNSMPMLRERNEKLSREIEGMKTMFPKVVEMQLSTMRGDIQKLADENADLQKQLQEAIDMGEAKKASDITQKMNINLAKGMGIKQQMDGLQKENISSASDGVHDFDKEKAWTNSNYPKLTLEQREIFEEAKKFIYLPQNFDMTTEQRIEYLEKKIYGKTSRSPSNGSPAAAPVSRPAGFSPTGNVSASGQSAWDKLSNEEKNYALKVVEKTWWYDKRTSDPKAKAEFDRFKKGFNSMI